MVMEQKIRDKLEAELRPTTLHIINESHLHAGHAGDDGSGESHFRIEIGSALFEGETRITQERLVYKALGDDMQKIHALSVKIIPT